MCGFLLTTVINVKLTSNAIESLLSKELTILKITMADGTKIAT